jgi:NAD(P)-dependent dehydrogenase (short-subunit alcohol dehydrogenase family)
LGDKPSARSYFRCMYALFVNVQARYRVVGDRLDILVANADVSKAATIEDTTIEDFDNVRAPYFLVQQLLARPIRGDVARGSSGRAPADQQRPFRASGRRPRRSPGRLDDRFHESCHFGGIHPGLLDSYIGPVSPIGAGWKLWQRGAGRSGRFSGRCRVPSGLCDRKRDRSRASFPLCSPAFSG